MLPILELEVQEAIDTCRRSLGDNGLGCDKSGHRFRLQPR
jgi:hypothetical protein